MNLIKACETESGLDFLQESFVLTAKQKEAVLQQCIIFWTNAIAEDIQRGNVNMFSDHMTNWTDDQRSLFIAGMNNDGLLDLDGEHREILQEGLGMKRGHKDEPGNFNMRQKAEEHFTIQSDEQDKVRKTTGTI